MDLIEEADGQDYVLRVDIKVAGYEEEKPAIRDVSLQVAPGQLVGLIGPNGAGKSTTIKTILGLMAHVDGNVTLGGRHKRYAYVPEQPVFYEYFTLWEHLRLAASAFGMEEDQFAGKAEQLLKRFRLTGERNHYPAHFSKGMQQKLMLIIAFLLEPDVYIVDEPFVGLDPRATNDFLSLLDAERQRGAGVLMSTHVLDTAERICQGFVLINSGAVVAKGTLAQVRIDAGCTEDATLFECFHALT
ncbi:ABC transporter ATP-binding protein [Paenibacillus arenilitoris]|uniref:ABC transporter ATP-binding protein n=1 Tax=Paenibacillus arenilitoris TaxID=2772299 RepID=A0A927CPV8_9BACL|nr:ABC transporter ATP-binding protein [Paenibacillus arenilitoris]MBD2871335.1 ABC transporter ATP-binding protein [Paenibacillus arenilitoris]